MSLPTGQWRPQGPYPPQPYPQQGYPQPFPGQPMAPRPVPGHYQRSSFGGGFGGGFGAPPAGWRPPGQPLYGPGQGGYGPPRRSGSGLLTGCLVVVAAVIVIGIAGAVILGTMLSGVDVGLETTDVRTPEPVETSTVLDPTDDPTPEPTPEPTDPTPEPTPEPGEFQLPPQDFGELPPPHSDAPAWVTVQQADIYAATFPALTGCPAPDYVQDMAALEVYSEGQLACIQAAWKPVLTSLGLPDHDIPHYFYAGSTGTSACGTMTAPAFYCSADGGTIYFGEDLLQGTTYDTIWAKDLIGHEYGHHLQALSGFFDAMYELPQDNEILRRNEIQATCYGFGMLRRDDSYTLDQQFYDGIEPHLRSFLDDDIHGSEDSLAYWGMRGFYSDVVGGCNTWTVGAEWVE